MRILDLFCCEGGAATGYHQAGFEVVGVDIVHRPNYPFDLVVADALEYGYAHGHEFDAIHASPPCQAYSKAQRLRDNQHPDLVGPTREMLETLGKPWVIENVPGAPLRDPVELCGAMFGLRTYRHRLFETGGFELVPPPHPVHVARTTKMGRPLKEGEFMHVVGNFSGVATARDIMGMPWASREGLAEAIPPAYTRYIGGVLDKQLRGC